MWGVLAMVFMLVTVHGHSNKIQNEADLQTSLMPQELNPEFAAAKEEPWKAIMPISRMRRELPLDRSLEDGYSFQLKKYSRITACVVLAMSAVVEITLYFLDIYWT